MEALLRLFNTQSWICFFNLSWWWATLADSKRVDKGLSICDLRRSSSYYYCLCRLKTLCCCWLGLSALLSILLCTLQYLTALAFVTLIFDCINPTGSSRCIHVAASPFSQHCIRIAPPLIMFHRATHCCTATHLLISK